MISSAEQLTQEEYPLYGGARIAGFTPDQMSAFDATRTAAGAGQGQLGLAGLYNQMGATAIPDADIQAYMNPYIQAAIDPAARELTRSYLTDVQNTRGLAALNDAFGGSRSTLMETELARGFGENLSDLYARGLSSAYQQGTQQYQTDAQRQLQAAQQSMGLADLSQTMGLRGAGAIQQIGTQQQAQEQANLDVAYGDFLEQRNWPYGQLSFLKSILQGGPQVGTIQTTSSQNQPSNTTAQLLGAGLTGLGTLGNLGIL